MAKGTHNHPPEKTQSPPTQFPQTTPPGYGPDQHSWILQTTMEMQKTLGGLAQAVQTLTTQIDRQSGKLDSISHRIYAAGAVIAVLLAIGGFILNKMWDRLVALIALVS